MESVKVSICIPAYNYAKFLPQALDSAVAQTYKNKEIIVIDDCSTDNTLEVMAEYQKLHPEVKYVRHSENQGLSATRNTGLEEFTGDWVMFLDADDWIDKDLIELCIPYAEAKKADIVGVWQQEFGEREFLHNFHPNPAHEDFLTGNKINCSSLFKRAVYEKIGGYDVRLKRGYEDWQFWLRATKVGFSVVTVPLALFHYRIHSGSMIAGLIKNNERGEVLEEMKASIPEIFA